MEEVFGGPLPPAKFFHSVPVALAGRPLRALRHNMSGQDGYELIDDWADAGFVKETLLAAGEQFGIVHVGQRAYASATLVLHPEDVEKHSLTSGGFYLTYARHRVEAADGALAGLTHQTATIAATGTVLSLTLLDRSLAEPGTEVTVVWGEHPGPGTAPGADLGFPRIRATVQPAPFDAHARKAYHRHEL